MLFLELIKPNPFIRTGRGTRPRTPEEPCGRCGPGEQRPRRLRWRPPGWSARGRQVAVGLLGRRGHGGGDVPSGQVGGREQVGDIELGLVHAGGDRPVDHAPAVSYLTVWHRGDAEQAAAPGITMPVPHLHGRAVTAEPLYPAAADVSWDAATGMLTVTLPRTPSACLLKLPH